MIETSGLILKHAEMALMVAEDVLGMCRRPKGRRDENGVRGLACYTLATVTKAHWTDIAESVYGSRRHATAICGAKRWVGSNEGCDAVKLFKSKLVEHKEVGIWDVIKDLRNRIEVLECDARKHTEGASASPTTATGRPTRSRSTSGTSTVRAAS